MIYIITYILDIFFVIQKFLEIVGVSIIIGGIVVAIYNYLEDYFSKKLTPNLRYCKFRFTIAKSTISGLEVMVAADVINTAHDLDYYSLGLIGLLVIIRTILSYSLSKDLEYISSKDQRVLDENK